MSNQYCGPEQNSNLGPSRIAVFEDCKANVLTTHPPLMFFCLFILLVSSLFCLALFDCSPFVFFIFMYWFLFVYRVVWNNFYLEIWTLLVDRQKILSSITHPKAKNVFFFHFRSKAQMLLILHSQYATDQKIWGRFNKKIPNSFSVKSIFF